MNKIAYIILLSFMMAVLAGCSSAPRKEAATPKPQMQMTSIDSAAVKAIADSVKKKPLQNLDVSHAAFLTALELELRGEKDVAVAFWLQAHEADPENRFLAFSLAERIAAFGDEVSLNAATDLALKANGLEGKKTASQLELLARLYLRQGQLDSAHVYFAAALDSCRYQDMSLLYDYSLFLEAIHDTVELVHVYDQLLPQTNYIQSLLQRQLQLLLNQGKDSALVDLLGDAYEAHGDKKFLALKVQGLLEQKRLEEAMSVADTISMNSDYDIEIIMGVVSALAEIGEDTTLTFIKKKVYQDSVRVPQLLYSLGMRENAKGEKDSAKVHLEEAYPLLTNEPAYAAQICRTLAGIAIGDEKNDLAVKYAERADSIMGYSDKVFLAMTYGFTKRYPQAYHLLDSLTAVWKDWKPMNGVPNTSAVEEARVKTKAMYNNVLLTYARTLIVEARDIDDNLKTDSAGKARGQEIRARANDMFAELLVDSPKNSFIQYSMATNLERMKKHDEAFAMFDALVNDTTENGLDKAEILNYYGYTLIDLNRSPEEVAKGFAMVMKALDLEKENNSVEAYMDSKAWGLYRQGKYEEALAIMEQIKGKQLLEDYVYWEHLGAIQAALGKNKEATQTYKKLLKLYPGHPGATEFLKKKTK